MKTRVQCCGWYEDIFCTEKKYSASLQYLCIHMINFTYPSLSVNILFIRDVQRLWGAVAVVILSVNHQHVLCDISDFTLKETYLHRDHHSIWTWVGEKFRVMFCHPIFCVASQHPKPPLSTVGSLVSVADVVRLPFCVPSWHLCPVRFLLTHKVFLLIWQVWA